MREIHLIDSYILNALYAGICVSLIGGGLGCFVIWKRMAYFGDSLSHSSLLGIALGIASTSLKVLLGVDRSYLGSGED